MSETARRWLISTSVTFLTGFALVFVNEIDGITLESFTDGTLTGLIFATIPVGVKAVIKMFIASERQTTT